MAVRPSRRRRRLLQGAGALASLGLVALTARAGADPDRAFAAVTFADAMAALGGVPRPSPQITLDVPGLAEDGAVVPVTINTTLPGTREILILVDGNPQPMAASFSIPEGTAPQVAARIRMAASGTVYAAVRTDDGLFVASRAVEVGIGGCG